MSNTVRSVIELSLLEFGVRYRKLGDDLYFCMLPNGLTFDLRCSDDGTLRMWRFVDSTPMAKSGTRFVCCRANAALGIEITDEGDLELFAEYQYDQRVLNAEQHIYKMLAGYIDVITHYESRKSTVGY